VKDCYKDDAARSSLSLAQKTGEERRKAEVNVDSDCGPVRDDAVFRNDDDAVADVVERVIDVFGFAGGGDEAVVADARVFVDDGVFDVGVPPNADAGQSARFVLFDGRFGFVVVATEQYGAIEVATFLNDAAHTNDGVVDLAAIQNTAVRNGGVIDFRAVDFRSRQKARARKDRRAHVEEIESR